MTPKPKQAVAAIRLPVETKGRHVYDVHYCLCECGTESQARQIAHALNSLPGLVDWLFQKKRELRDTPEFQSDEHLRGEYFAYTRVEDFINTCDELAKAAAEKGMV